MLSNKFQQITLYSHSLHIATRLKKMSLLRALLLP